MINKVNEQRFHALWKHSRYPLNLRICFPNVVTKAYDCGVKVRIPTEPTVGTSLVT